MCDACKRSLGGLNYIRLWHDNTGKDPSWFVSFVVVRDLQTLEQYVFLMDDWLSTESPEGLSRIVPSATPNELSEWGRLMSANSVHMFNNDHLWYSSFSGSAPSEKQFTRLQRLSVCFMLVFLHMVASALFYGKRVKKQADTTGFIIGVCTRVYTILLF